MVWSLAGSARRAGRSHACLSVYCSGSAPSGGASPASSAAVGRNGSRLDDTICGTVRRVIDGISDKGMGLRRV
jgi:hypothetical protein